ncbi:hypothetical protein BABINDRAFT_159696 [Babjeviella inositovora NRRL Y-12698]|uniref:Quinate transporter n=1 Tax=Babjeviella inositovora NRRL Y-12698 TaxID=984486 RepID=A0A1E3R1M7_9ASCO|nr:uncharacterized protein BABINDRAFT_159696 [Babjeviella inositovora NRRL Y-12698]ODQ83262.1 hypothetical protein BABINDRAFT_159696 [Babjeviella inositovora NRRL Y-12698]
MVNVKNLFSSFSEKKESRPTPPEVYNIRVYIAAIVACFAAVVIGYDAGFIGGTVALTTFKDEFGYAKMLAAEQTLTTSNIISLFHAGAFFGAFFIYPIGRYYGRVVGFALSGLIITLGSGIQLASNARTGLSAIYAGRVLTGVGIGAISNLAPMYVSEIAPSAIRGRLVGMYEIAWQVGGLVGFFINFGTEQHFTTDMQWRIPLAVQLIPSGMFFVGVLFLKESPKWCFSAGKKDKGLNALCYLRNLSPDSEYIAWEVAMMEEEVAERDATVGTSFTGPFKALFGSKALRYRLLLTTSTFILQNTTGVNAINYYSVQVMKTMGISSLSAGLLSTGVFGVIKGVFCFIWAFFIVDNFGRRTPIYWGTALGSFSLWYIGAYIKIANPAAKLAAGISTSDAGSKAALAFFYIWTVGYAIGWSGLPWVLNSEMFDQSNRTLASCFNAASNWFWAFIFARFSGNMITKMGYGTFFFFAAMLIIACVIYMLLYPDTKGIPIGDVDMLFEKGVAPWRAHSRAMELIRLREEQRVTPDWVKRVGKGSQEHIETVSDFSTEKHV